MGLCESKNKKRSLPKCSENDRKRQGAGGVGSPRTQDQPCTGFPFVGLTEKVCAFASHNKEFDDTESDFLEALGNQNRADEKVAVAALEDRCLGVHYQQ